MARKEDDYLDRVNQTLLAEEEDEEEVLPAPPPTPSKVRMCNADRTDVDLEEYAEQLEEKSVTKVLTVLLVLLLLGAVFVGLALWMKFGGGLPW